MTYSLILSDVNRNTFDLVLHIHSSVAFALELSTAVCPVEISFSY